MPKENKYRNGIDDKPLTAEEFERLKKGGSLYRHVTAPCRPEEAEKKDKPRMAV